MKKSNIFLIGPMGAGKTTIGRQLARRLNMDFYDSDRVIEEKTGVDIPLIFEKEGEAGFRQREAAVIDELTLKEHIVLATGGGAVLDENSRHYLKSRGTVFYLCSDLKSLLERTHKDKNRPLLHGEEPAATILTRLIEQREPLYRETAHYVVNTSNDSLRHVIQVIIGHLNGPE